MDEPGYRFFRLEDLDMPTSDIWDDMEQSSNDKVIIQGIKLAPIRADIES